MLRVICSVNILLLLSASASFAAPDWPLWKSYTASFMDDQIRVIDRDAGGRTTSEAQAYAMFFALVANDRSRFEGLLRWTEQNLASGDLSKHLPAWLWGRRGGESWGVLDNNSAADADVWMAYSLLEAGRAWNEARYTKLGTAMTDSIANQEVVAVPGLGTTLMPAPRGFHHRDIYRLNASYVPLQLLLRLARLRPNGPWPEVAASVPTVIKDSAPHGFAMDWIEFAKDGSFAPSPIGGYEAIRVYLWAGMLDPSTPNRDTVLAALSGMAEYLRKNGQPPAKVRKDGSIEDAKGSIGFSGALLPLLSAAGENDLRDRQMNRIQAELDPSNGLYGKPAKYYDQNLLLFALGSAEHRFWFDSQGELKTAWSH